MDTANRVAAAVVEAAAIASGEVNDEVADIKVDRTTPVGIGRKLLEAGGIL